MERELFERELAASRSLDPKIVEKRFSRSVKAWRTAVFLVVAALTIGAIAYGYVSANVRRLPIFPAVISMLIVYRLVRKYQANKTPTCQMELTRADAPALFACIDDVARRFNLTTPRHVGFSPIHFTAFYPRNHFLGATPQLIINMEDLVARPRDEFEVVIAQALLTRPRRQFNLEYAYERVVQFWTPAKDWLMRDSFMRGLVGKRMASAFQRMAALHLAWSQNLVRNADLNTIAMMDRDAVCRAICRPPFDVYSDWRKVADAVTGTHSSWSFYRSMDEHRSSLREEDTELELARALNAEVVPASAYPPLTDRLVAIGETNPHEESWYGIVASEIAARRQSACESIFGADAGLWLERFDKFWASLHNSDWVAKVTQESLDELHAKPEKTWRADDYARAHRNHQELGQVELAKDVLAAGLEHFPDDRDLIWCRAKQAVLDKDPKRLEMLEEVAATDFLRRPWAIEGICIVLREDGQSKEAYDREWQWSQEAPEYELHRNNMLDINRSQAGADVREALPDEDAESVMAQVKELHPTCRGFYLVQRIDESKRFEPRFVVMVPNKPWYRMGSAVCDEIQAKLTEQFGWRDDWFVVVLREEMGLANAARKRRFSQR